MFDQSITRAGARRLRSSVRWRLAPANCEPLPTTLEEGSASRVDTDLQHGALCAT